MTTTSGRPARSRDRRPAPADDPERGARRTLADTWRTWVAQAVRPRFDLVALLPLGGRGPVAALTAFSVVLGLLPVVFVLTTSALVGKVPAAIAQGVGGDAWGRLVGLFLLGSAVFVLTQVLAPVQAALGTRLRRRVDAHLRDQAMAELLRPVGIGPLEEQGAKDDLDEVTRVFEREWGTPGQACYGLVTLVARYTRLAALVVLVAVSVGWPAALATGTATMLFRYGQRGGLRKYSEIQRTLVGVYREAGYFERLALTDRAAKESRVFGLTGWLGSRYDAAARDVCETTGDARRRVYLRQYATITPLALVLVGAALVWTAHVAASGAVGLTDVTLAAQSIVAAVGLGGYYPESDTSTQYAMHCLTALRRLRARFDAAEQAALAGSAAARTADHLPGTAERPGTAVEGPSGLPARSLTFEDVTFRYPGSDVAVLDGLDLTLPAGLCTAVVGVNGAGKTTLVKLLTRLYEPDAGTIRADGLDVASFDPEAWRRQVAVIFQDFVRFEMSATDNIALGAGHAAPDPDAVRRSAERAGIAEALLALPAGLGTPLSRAYEGGTDLSGGQWQRVAIARSLYAVEAGAKVLVLDEPTSALDVRAETAFFDSFVELTRGVTSLLVSHRFSSVRRADRIVVVDGGRVVEQGGHDELMAADGHYARLFRLQAERFAQNLDADGNPAPGSDADARQEAAR